MENNLIRKALAATIGLILMAFALVIVGQMVDSRLIVNIGLSGFVLALVITGIAVSIGVWRG